MSKMTAVRVVLSACSTHPAQNFPACCKPFATLCCWHESCSPSALLLPALVKSLLNYRICVYCGPMFTQLPATHAHFIPVFIPMGRLPHLCCSMKSCVQPPCRAPEACCLQEELPAQDQMKVGGHNGFLPYMSVANGILGSLSGPERAAVSHSPPHSWCHIIPCSQLNWLQ